MDLFKQTGAKLLCNHDSLSACSAKLQCSERFRVPSLIMGGFFVCLFICVFVKQYIWIPGIL